MLIAAAIPHDQDDLEAWQFRALVFAISAGAELRAIVRSENSRPATPYARALARLGLPSIRRIENSDQIAAVPRIALSAFDVAQMDAVIDFTYEGAVSERVWSAATELWRFETNDRRNRPIESEGAVWPLRSGEMTVTPMLVASRNTNDVRVLVRGTLATARRSYAKSVDRVLAEVAKWPSYAVRDRMRGFDATHERIAFAASPPARQADAWTILWGITVRWMRRLATVFIGEQWNVGIAEVPVAEFALGNATPPVRWFPYIKNSEFLADPMGRALADGSVEVFCEVFPYRTARGSVIALSYREGVWSAGRRTLLDGSHHWSYPYLIERDGTTYCVPETHEANEIAAYVEEPWSKQWRKHAILIDNYPGADSTIFQHDGRWWLLCTRTDDAPNEKLHAWYADDLYGPWTPHAGNPVKIDVRSARPAGPPFEHEGALYRPAQDCSHSYGGRITLNRMVRITPDEFIEEAVKVIEPTKSGVYRHAIHTLAGVGKQTLIDGRKRVFTLEVALQIATSLMRLRT